MLSILKRLKALGDGTRLKVLALLSVRPCCVCELAEVLKLSQPTMTRHLQKLEEAGLVRHQRIRNFQIYSLSPEDEEARALLELVLGNLEDTPEMKQLKERLKSLKIGPEFLRKRCGDGHRL